MSDRFEDERGVIEDLFDGQPVNVTKIMTRKGCVRGNHFHRLTTQWTFVFVGKLLVASGDQRDELHPSFMIRHDPGEPHAWQALEDWTTCFVFTRGPRSGEDYESDTYRLEEPLL